MSLISFGLRRRPGKLFRPLGAVNAARRALPPLALAAAVGCSHTMRPVPREGVNEVHEYLSIPARSPSALETVGTEPRRVWRTEAGRGTVGSPAVGERITVVTSVDRTITALDTRSGQIFWRVRAENPFTAGPLLANGRVYAATEGQFGQVLAYNVRTAKRLWRTRVGDVSAPIALHDSLIFGTTATTGTTFALNAGTGRVLWTRHTGASRSGPLAAGRWVAVVTLTDSLMVMDATVGSILSRTGLGTSSLAPLALADDSTVVLTSPAGRVIAVTLPTGRVRWEVRTGDPVYGPPVVARDTVFALTNRCALWAIPLAAAAAADSASYDCLTVAGPSILRDGVLVATIHGQVALFDRGRREPVWSRDVGGELRHAPVVHNQQIVVAPILGQVMSFR